ncbi:MAG: hypothetical protein NTW87_23050 [Planctomycetota bacterium]|nr:hypothetical protein [Planctomycetota bacterium]
MAPGDFAELTIRLRPEEARAAERRVQLDLYRKSVAGDASAAQAWQKLPAATRTAVLAELAATHASLDNLPNCPTKDGVAPGAARTQAIRELARLSPSDDPEGRGLKALARVATAEGDGSLRGLARKGLVARDDPRVPGWLLQAAEQDDGLERANAVEALKALGSPRVFEVIIEHWKEVWGAGPRTHMFVGTMRSYVADYDISGDSYQPVIRNFFTGVVLDAKVLKVEHDFFIVTIREIAPAGVALPNDPAAWQRWLNKERPNLAKAAESARRAAAASLAGPDAPNEE